MAWESNRTAIYCDVPLLIEGATLAIPAGCTLLVKEESRPDFDERWPSMDPKYWIVRSEKKIKMMLGKEKPKTRPGETAYIVTSALFI